MGLSVELLFLAHLCLGASSCINSCFGYEQVLHKSRFDFQIKSERFSNVTQILNVMDFGAKGNGNEDDTQAFNSTWLAACASENFQPTVYIPKGKVLLLSPHSFRGPCQSTIAIKVEGRIVAPRLLQAWASNEQYWLQFKKMGSFVLSGNGVFDGRGENWWSCIKTRRKGHFSSDHGCKARTIPPNLLRISRSTNVVVENVSFINAQRTHVDIHTCHGVQIRGVKIKSPSGSPNTDGIHIQRSTYVDIQNSSMHTGDDCISIGPDTFHLTVHNITCGPGHGISVGSLGKSHTKAEVSNISVSDAIISSTRYGVRIKTWQGGAGFARFISFENITMSQVRMPILINQQYCTKEDEPCLNETTTIQVSDVLYRNINGTCSTKEAITFYCNKNVPCRNITLENIDLKSVYTTEAVCLNANGVGHGLINPLGCF